MIVLELHPVLAALLAHVVLWSLVFGVASALRARRLGRRLDAVLARRVDAACLVMELERVMEGCPRCAMHLDPPSRPAPTRDSGTWRLGPPA